jgi:hypothetical protein
MVATLTTRVAFRPEQKVTHLALAGDGSFLAWAEQGGLVSIASLRDGEVSESRATWSTDASIVGLATRGSRLFVLDDLNGLTCLASDGSVAWFFEVAGGGFSLHEGPHSMAIVDALGRLQSVGYDGQEASSPPNTDGILKALFVQDCLVLAHEDGSVQALRNSTCVWRRPTRGDVGESITALGSTSDGHLVLGREGYALVDGDEEALEMEVWCLETQRLLERTDLKTRLTHCHPGTTGVVCGYDNGLVTHYTEGAHTELMNTQYAVQSLMVAGEHMIVSSWFYLFGLTTSGIAWKVEHQGMPTLLAVSDDAKHCFFAGEDQNDWTDPEPIGVLSLASEHTELDASELTEWFQKDALTPQLSAEEIYRVDDSVENLLTEEERNMTEGASSASLDSLREALGDLNEELNDDPSVSGTLNVDAASLLDAMDDDLSTMAMLPDEDLFDALNESVVAPILPIPRAGEDRQVTCEEDGTAIVLLDGFESEDVQNRIVMWFWVDATGKEISSQPQVKVRLEVGVHRFELRICDSDGRWSSDSVQLTLNKA